MKNTHIVNYDKAQDELAQMLDEYFGIKTKPEMPPVSPFVASEDVVNEKIISAIALRFGPGQLVRYFEPF